MYTCHAADPEDGGPIDRHTEIARKYQAKVASPVIHNAIRKTLQRLVRGDMHMKLADANKKGLHTHVGNLYPDVYKHMLLKKQFTQM